MEAQLDDHHVAALRAGRIAIKSYTLAVAGCPLSYCRCWLLRAADVYPEHGHQNGLRSFAYEAGGEVPMRRLSQPKHSAKAMAAAGTASTAVATSSSSNATTPIENSSPEKVSRGSGTALETPIAPLWSCPRVRL